jgi:hypothetical protein
MAPDVVPAKAEERTYPFTLGYTDDDGNPVRVVVRNADEADEAFHKMFRATRLGEAIPYSVD